MKNINIGLPKQIFFTGAPGSKWSGVAQFIESNSEFDITDRTGARTYSHHKYSGHKGAYYGNGMEFLSELNIETLDAPYNGTGTRLYKSHDWSYMLDEITERFPEAWIIMVRRDDQECFEWWKQAGGFDITYPKYDWYKNDYIMQNQITKQNALIIDFCRKKQLQWNKWDTLFAQTVFGLDIDIPDNDITIAIYKQ